MLDQTDMQILEQLSRNSRITMKELGEIVHLTGPATSARVAKLEDMGIIEGYTIQVNQAKLGYLVHAIIHIYTRSTNHQPYLSFLKGYEQNVVNNFKVSGDSCYLLECRFQSNDRLDEFLTGLSNNYVGYQLSIVINK
ncbi:Lrp/AsnC family transcriptional regulator [Ureibacillus aquaedulcis]|uniref:Lrp/AsnC family transcriptional regulator n=1 Tax=Ureibacillus aquaedulcis TaxID=3058421 RepID=A0ABT8GMY1_9BACL|nr:Lrp/AsnC family transcriptional regulator [Ureibacillus sp. BA0131]MDN4492759.1 Lrp/AsnC family transcriptional regulator [Ureibacillus sp. BA0131]